MYGEYNEYGKDEQFAMGQRVQKRRREKGIAGADMAEMLGIGKNQLSRIENGRATCSMEQLFVLAQVLDCSADYLLFGKDMLAVSEKQMLAIEHLINVFS